MVLANGLIVLCLPARLLLNSPAGEDILLMLAAPLLWSTLLHFIAAFKVTGPFVAMIRYMIVRDLKQFSLIYLIFAYAFAQSIFFVQNLNQRVEKQQQQQQEESLADLLKQYLNLWMDLFKMTLNVYDLQPFRHSIMSRLFMLLFIYLISILFNMLIAMMNNTYSMIISQSERAWSFQWARTLFALERQLSERQQLAYLKKYSINMVDPRRKRAASGAEDKAEDKQVGDDGKDDKCFVPALMIIKRMNCTRAERRRLILGFWQRSIGKILHDIRASRRPEPMAAPVELT